MKEKNVVKRIFAGFGLILTLLMLLGAWSVLSIGSLTGNAEEVISGNALKSEMSAREIDHLLWAASLNATFTDKNKTEVTVEIDPTQCAFGKWYYGEGRKNAVAALPLLKEPLAAIEEPHRHLHESAEAIKDVFVQADVQMGAFLRGIKSAHLTWDNNLKEAIMNTDSDLLNKIEMNPEMCALGKWLNSEMKKDLVADYPELSAIFRELDDKHGKLHRSAKDIAVFINQGDSEQAREYYFNTTHKLIEEVVGQLEAVIAWHDKAVEAYLTAETIFIEQTRPNLSAVQDHLHNVIAIVDENVLTDEGLLNNARTAQVVIVVMAFIALAGGAVIAITLGKSIKGSLKTVMNSLRDGSMEIANASSQVASSSEILASETSEQAASLEEISSSLQEITSMIKMTSKNTSEANLLSSQTRDTAESGSASMHKMSQAIGRIRKSADETANIVKTIDEIAFQTNLLALNAAVEAARAGDAGKGFAVVAEEVRNLAQRSAQAAKSTSELIAESIENAKHGVAVNDEVNKNLDEIVERVGKITALVSEISNASDEQAKGIEELSRSVVQMDEITQNNASNAEESATAAEEMSAQSEELRKVVQKLARICGEKNGQEELSSQDRQQISTRSSGNRKDVKALTAGKVSRVESRRKEKLDFDF